MYGVSSRDQRVFLKGISIRKNFSYLGLGLCITLFFLILFAYSHTYNKNQRLELIVVEVIGDNFNWTFRYPGADGILGNDDDKFSMQNLYLPDHAEVTLQLASKDYLYSFALPDYKVSQIAVPGLNFELNFITGDAKTILLLGDQFCGFSHDSLKGKVYVINQDEGFYNWKSKLPSP